MRATGLTSAAGASALLLCLLAPASPAQDASRHRAPIVRVYSQEGAGVVSSYVTPAIQVSEDAYVFAVMMDLDGRIQVLHPEFPGISVRIRSDRQLRLPNFFAGYNAPMQGGGYYTRNGLVSQDRYDALGTDTRGTVIALASRAPFNLEAIEANGDWNISELRRLIDNRTPESAAQLLARYLGAKGEPIGVDYMRFAGQRPSYYAYDDLGYCGYGGYGSLAGALYRAQAFGRSAELRSRGLRAVILGYDACGFPVVGVASVAAGRRFPLPLRRSLGDTTVFPKSRFPQAGIPRHAINEGITLNENTPRPVPAGIFPLPRHGEPQMGARTIPALEGRRAEPREIPNQFRSSEPRRSAYPDRARMPVETGPARAEPAVGAFQPAREYRPEPRVIVQPAREPAREPERVRESPPPPPPVVHERPAPPPPSPKTEPAHDPPPRRR